MRGSLNVQCWVPMLVGSIGSAGLCSRKASVQSRLGRHSSWLRGGHHPQTCCFQIRKWNRESLGPTLYQSYQLNLEYTLCPPTILKKKWIIYCWNDFFPSKSIGTPLPIVFCFAPKGITTTRGDDPCSASKSPTKAWKFPRIWCRVYRCTPF